MSDVFEDPRHPYTQGLLGAVPVVDDNRPARKREPLTTMPGLPPDPAALPPGCAFYPRCPVRSSPRCANDLPPLAAAAGDGEHSHRVATFYEAPGRELA